MCDDNYELFRRAIVEREAHAWAMIAARYRPLMIAWASHCIALAASGECCGDLADEALARAWMALVPERFASFPSLAALLAYLRSCVVSTVIDAARGRARQEQIFQQGNGETFTCAEEDVLSRLDRIELWELVMSCTKSEIERVVLRERFVYDLPPRIILERHPTLFPGINAVYTTSRNLCDRLRRHKKIAHLYAAVLEL
jgi:DNA-directed RNA polymerase specialized sigma24 family protein